VSVAVLFGVVILSCTLYTTFRHVSILEDLHVVARTASSGSVRYGTVNVDANKDQIISEVRRM
jgi:hypothetical protein